MYMDLSISALAIFCRSHNENLSAVHEHCNSGENPLRVYMTVIPIVCG